MRKRESEEKLQIQKKILIFMFNNENAIVSLLGVNIENLKKENQIIFDVACKFNVGIFFSIINRNSIKT